MVYLIHYLQTRAWTDVGQAAWSDTAAESEKIFSMLFIDVSSCFMILVQSCATWYKSFIHALVSFYVISFHYHFNIGSAGLIWYDWYLIRYRTSNQALYSVSTGLNGGFSSVVCAALLHSGRCHRGGGGAVYAGLIVLS